VKIQWYVDLISGQPLGSRGPSGTAIDALASALRLAHGTAAAQNFKFATALPQMRCGERPHPGGVLRFFAEERRHLDAICEAVRARPQVADSLVIARVRPVPVGFPASVAYMKFLIASRKSAARVHGEERRRARIARGDLLPYFKVRSSSTGQGFSLRVEHKRLSAEEARERPVENENAEPNSYGLSVRTRPFFLPDLPVNIPWNRANLRELAAAE